MPVVPDGDGGAPLVAGDGARPPKAVGDEGLGSGADGKVAAVPVASSVAVVTGSGRGSASTVPAPALGPEVRRRRLRAPAARARPPAASRTLRGRGLRWRPRTRGARGPDSAGAGSWDTGGSCRWGAVAALVSPCGLVGVFVVITVPPRNGPSPMHMRPLRAVRDARYALPWGGWAELG
ncbi:hypothetical protein CEB94_25885 [Streptomyces hawaiiensis]|uniref:Uncharacterized protein n=1 Tax=Streptomyces hawaiiensis TaxID=67305 RepID=A0A6G5RID8_9ACTN|nr:hypothetical protein CEB94_25885 [Streptomyces hawaiiensis]